MQRVQDTLAREAAYLGQDEMSRLRLAVEISYQSHAWSAAGRSDKRLAHAVAVARVLAEQQMEAQAVLAALLVGVCEDSGLTYLQLEEILGSAVAAAVRDVTHVWQLSGLLQEAPAASSEQLEHRCQIVLAGCDDWRGVVLSLASRLVEARELQGQAQRRAQMELQLEEANAEAEENAEENAEGALGMLLEPAGGLKSAAFNTAEDEDDSSAAFALQTLQVFVPLAHRLGMWYFKSELEQRCFALTRPRDFERISGEVRLPRPMEAHRSPSKPIEADRSSHRSSHRSTRTPALAHLPRAPRGVVVPPAAAARASSSPRAPCTHASPLPPRPPSVSRSRQCSSRTRTRCTRSP